MWLCICVHMCMYEQVVQPILRVLDEQIEGVILIKSDVFSFLPGSAAALVSLPLVIKQEAEGLSQS